MADYVDALFAAMGGDHLEPRGRARAVHDAMRAREIRLLKPLLEYLASRNSVRLIGPSDAAGERRPSPCTEVRGEALAAELAAHDIMAGGGISMR